MSSWDSCPAGRKEGRGFSAGVLCRARLSRRGAPQPEGRAGLSSPAACAGRAALGRTPGSDWPGITAESPVKFVCFTSFFVLHSSFFWISSPVAESTAAKGSVTAGPLFWKAKDRSPVPGVARASLTA